MQKEISKLIDQLPKRSKTDFIRELSEKSKVSFHSIKQIWIYGARIVPDKHQKKTLKLLAKKLPEKQEEIDELLKMLKEKLKTEK